MRASPTDRSDVSGACIGVDLGGTKLLAVRVGAQGQFVADALRPSPSSGPELVSAAVRAVEHLAGGAAGSLGIGVPGRVDRDDVVCFAPNLKGLVGCNVGEALRTSFRGSRVWVGNDASASCWAEHQVGAGRGSRDMIMVTLGTGIGGGMVVGGELVEGGGRFAGEVGHVVVDPSGPECPCGRRGCWERYASGNGLGRLGRQLAPTGRIPRVLELAGGDPEAIRGEHVSAAAAGGDGRATEVMATFARWVALGLANLVSILDPEVIVIGGGLVEIGELLMAPIRRSFDEQVVGGGVRRAVRIVPAELGPAAGAVGAGLLAAASGHP